MIPNPLITAYGSQRRWVNWIPVMKDGRVTKVPTQGNGALASTTDERTWTTFEEVHKASSNVGIVLTPDQTLLGIDIDHCINPLTNNIEHEQQEIIADLLLESETYTEISPSGTGLHLFFQISEQLVLEGNRKSPFECYTSGRYFTFTGNIYGKDAKSVRRISKNEAIQILSIIGYPWSSSSGHDSSISGHNSSKMLEFTDEEILSKMFSAKNGEKVKEIYDTSSKQPDKDISILDAQLCSHLAFWTNRNYSQMERLWLASPLGSRQKTQTRQDYRNRTISFAVAHCVEVYSGSSYQTQSSPETIVSDKVDLLYTLNSRKEKIYIQNTENISRVLSQHVAYKGRLRYDEFKCMIEYKKKDKWQQIQDNDDIDIQTSISVLYPAYFGKVGIQMVHDAIVKVAMGNSIDSARDYIHSLVWDHTARLDDWLHYTYGTPRDEYHTSVASNWMKGIIKRIIEPGCQFDYVLVLEGSQGSKKSTSLSVLGREWHVETNMGTDSKDFFMQFQGKVIVEFSEGETMNRTEVKKMKAIITTRVDRFRPPFGRNSMDFPRRCVFAMTTNQEEYLKDETGNRRYLPVKLMLPEANVNWLEDNRDQLFAEAYHRVFIKKEKVYEFPREATTAQQALRQIKDPNMEGVIDWYYNKILDQDRYNGVTILQAYRWVFCDGNMTKPMNKYQEMIIAEIFKNELHLTKKRKSIDGSGQLTRWVDETKYPILKKTEEMTAEMILDSMDIQN